jgi:hypothetical protein
MSIRSLKKPVSSPPAHKLLGVLTPRAAYDHFLPAAKLLADADVVPCRGDLPLALHNVQLGVDHVLPNEARIKKELPAIDLDTLRGLPNLAAGLLYAADRVSRPPSKADISQKLLRLRKLREPMLLIAEGLAEWGILPAERVAAIRAGKGAIDAARDGIALEALYREFEPLLRNKHPFGESDLKEVAELGNQLVRSITPDGGRHRLEAPSEETGVRDRLYTLLVRRHSELRKVGHYLYGDAMGEHVPPLSARIARPKAGPEPVPAPL